MKRPAARKWDPLLTDKSPSNDTGGRMRFSPTKLQRIHGKTNKNCVFAPNEIMIENP